MNIYMCSALLQHQILRLYFEGRMHQCLNFKIFLQLMGFNKVEVNPEYLVLNNVWHFVVLILILILKIILIFWKTGQIQKNTKTNTILSHFGMSRISVISVSEEVLQRSVVVLLRSHNFSLLYSQIL